MTPDMPDGPAPAKAGWRAEGIAWYGVKQKRMLTRHEPRPYRTNNRSAPPRHSSRQDSAGNRVPQKFISPY